MSDKRKKNLTIERRAEYCATAGDAMDIFTHHLDLGLKNKNKNKIVTDISRQLTFHVKFLLIFVNSFLRWTFSHFPLSVKSFEFGWSRVLILELNRFGKRQESIGYHISSRHLVECQNNVMFSYI